MATGNLTIVPNAVVREITVDKNTGLVNGANFLDQHSRREMHVKAQGRGARRVMPGEHAHPAQLGNREFQRRARATTCTISSTSRTACWRLSRKRRTAGRAGYGRRRLHPAVPQSARRAKEQDFIAGLRTISAPATRPTRSFSAYGEELQKQLDELSRRRLLGDAAWARCCRASRITSASTRM